MKAENLLIKSENKSLVYEKNVSKLILIWSNKMTTWTYCYWQTELLLSIYDVLQHCKTW